MDGTLDETTGRSLVTAQETAGGEVRSGTEARSEAIDGGDDGASGGAGSGVVTPVVATRSSAKLRVTINVAPQRRLSDDVRASLDAVRAGQLVARERARRETMRARVVVAGLAAVAAVGLFVVRPRFRAGQVASAATPAKVQAGARRSASTPHLPGRPAAPKGTAAVAAAAPSPAGLLAARVADLPAAVSASPTVAATGADLDDCRENYLKKRWHAAAESCAVAFSVHPNDADLALHVTEAQYARARLGEAREWAQKTLALAPDQAIALGILGRVERQAGDVEAAARTFRRYLAVAPHGWQAPEAHAALRAARNRTTHARVVASAQPPAPVAAAAAATTPAPFRPEDAPMPPSFVVEPAPPGDGND